MQSMTRSVSLNFNNATSRKSNETEAFDSETISLKQFCLPVRSYGTCGDFPAYVPSPTSVQNRYRKCITHVVAQHETLAGIALKYDITVEDIRRTNSFLWTSNSVWVGQVIKVPVILDGFNQGKSTKDPNDQQDCKSDNYRNKRRLSATHKMSPTDFWNKVDHSIEESKKNYQKASKEDSKESS